LSARNRQQEVLDHLAGFYEIAHRDPKTGFMSISFWLTKVMGNAQIPTEGLQIVAIKAGEKRILFPERLDTHVMPKRGQAEQPRLGLRLKLDALPENWIGECEFSFGRSYRCFSFKGIPDISASLIRPESSRPPSSPPQQATTF
jgi:hypothetical protein